MAYLDGWFGPEFLIYFGNFIALIVAMSSAAYVATKSIDAAVSTSNAFAAVYRNSTDLGNLLGLWELLIITLFLAWSLTVTIMGFITAADIHDLTTAREVAA